jgi:hypothetical protein
MKKYVLAIFVFTMFSVACKKGVDSIIEPTGKIVKDSRSTQSTIHFNGTDYLIANDMLNFTTFNQYENLFNLDNPNNLSDFATIVE